MPRKVFNRYVLWFSLVGAILALCPALRAQDTAPPGCQATIITDPLLADRSTVQGTLRGQSCVYLGVPYAASPAGAGRWQPPVSVTPWPGLKSFTKAGNMCPQLMGGGTVVGNEDCLNLNIFAPTNATALLPVIFFIHGGGNRSNSNRAEAGESLDGQYLAEHGLAVVVVINYRLGALGWLAHPALDAESATRTSGNYGMLDQIAALQWVQRNIAVFGGDPSRVTITGHSSGAADTAVLLVSPLARGLFASALVDASGSNFDQATLADYEARVGVPFAAKLLVAAATLPGPPAGCAQPVDIATCLRALPSSTIVKTVPGASGLLTEGTYQPVVDGVVLIDTPLEAAKEGEHNHVSTIIGGTSRELSNPNLLPLAAVPTDADYQATVYQFFGQAVGDQVLALYPRASYSTPRDALIAVATDYRFLCPQRRLARAVSDSQKEPVYRFVFTHAQSNPPAATTLGAWHGEELMFIFHSFTSGVSGPFTPTNDELTLSDQMIGYWTRFAAAGDPNGGNAPPWFVYGKNADPAGALFNQAQGYQFFKDTATGDDKKDVYLRFGEFGTSLILLAEGAGFDAEVCETFWDQLVGDTNNGHGEGSIAGDIDENGGNEAFITDADLDNDDQPPPPGN